MISQGFGALDGTRVLEFGHYVAGPMVGMLLADQGASVLKVERPGGDPARRLPAFAVWNRGKQSLVLDLKSKAGLKAALDLIATSDVLIENFAPGTADRLGIGYVASRKLNPALVYCSLPAFGKDHPRRQQAAGDPIVHSLVGFHTSVAHSDAIPAAEDRVQYTAMPVASTLAAVTATGAITSALFARLESDIGQHLEVPLHAAAFRALGIRAVTVHGQRRLSRYVLPLVHRYLCSDGRYVQLHGTFRQFARIVMEIIEHPEWSGEAESALVDGTTKEKMLEWRQRLEIALAQRTAFEWEELINRAGGAAAVCRSVDEWLETPHALEAGLVLGVRDPLLGEVLQPGLAVKLGRTPGRIRSSAPALNEHADGLIATDSRAKAARRRYPITARRVMLAGIKVLDLCIILAGPSCGRTLAELGAEVIKVDDPYRPEPDLSLCVDVNCGKRSILLNLKTEAGRSVFWKLASEADVILENFRAGALDRLGLGYEHIAERNPGVVYASLSAYGHGGRWSGRVGWEQVAEAVTGMEVARGGLEGSPLAFPFPICDYSAGALLVYAVVLALIERQRSGLGQHVMTSLAQAATLFQSRQALDYEGFHRLGVEGPGVLGEGALSRLYRAADGWLFLEVPDDDAWRRFVKMPQFNQLVHDVRFASSDARNANDAVLAGLIAAIVVEQRRSHWLDVFGAASIRCSERLFLPEVLLDVDTRRSGVIVQHDLREVGIVEHYGVANLDSSAMPKLNGTPITRLGEHGRQILADLGYQHDEVEALISAGAVSLPALRPAHDHTVRA